MALLSGVLGSLILSGVLGSLILSGVPGSLILSAAPGEENVMVTSWALKSRFLGSAPGYITSYHLSLPQFP